MATHPIETRSERVVVLMTPSEKRAATERARTAGVTLAEFVREAVDEFMPITAAQRAEMEYLTERLRETNDRTEAALNDIERRLAAPPIDEDVLRAKYRAEFEAMDIDWAGVADRLGLTRN